MQFQYNDGGRETAGFKGHAGDCACRAIAIAASKPYREVYNTINCLAIFERPSKRYSGFSNARTGVHRPVVHEYLTALGFKWTPTMFIGQGCKVHLRADELPTGRLIVSLSRHYAAVIDGVLHDTHDGSRNETRCVYGYWRKT